MLQVTEAANSHKKDKKKPTSNEFLSGFWKSDRRLPVIMLVIYYGADEWDGPLSLREMYADCDEGILKYAADYHINLMTSSRLSDDEIDEFHTNFREIMKYIKYSKDRKITGQQNRSCFLLIILYHSYYQTGIDILYIIVYIVNWKEHKRVWQIKIFRKTQYLEPAKMIKSISRYMEPLFLG